MNLSAVDRQAWATKRETEKWMGMRPSANVLGPVTTSERLGTLAWGADTWFAVRPHRSTKEVASKLLDAIRDEGISWLRAQEFPISPARKPIPQRRQARRTFRALSDQAPNPRSAARLGLL